MDEQWAGYDYYAASANGEGRLPTTAVQGLSASAPVRPECLTPEFSALAHSPEFDQPFPDRLRNLQYRDLRYTKIPRALRFNDRISMRSSTELRVPFLDHRLVELALRQPADRKLREGTSKWLLRRIAHDLIPSGVVLAPKRPIQTPQREWLRGPLRAWATECIEQGLSGFGADWLDARKVRAAWQLFCEGQGDNSFFIWQWISLGLATTTFGGRSASAEPVML
jgi:asparagine synthase (glutamine-hydrolysing)